MAFFNFEEKEIVIVLVGFDEFSGFGCAAEFGLFGLVVAVCEELVLSIVEKNADLLLVVGKVFAYEAIAEFALKCWLA
jgi:hypothetical protein